MADGSAMDRMKAKAKDMMGKGPSDKRKEAEGKTPQAKDRAERGRRAEEVRDRDRDDT